MNELNVVTCAVVYMSIRVVSCVRIEICTFRHLLNMQSWPSG